MPQITKRPDETWLEAILRYAKPYGLQEEVVMEYLKQRNLDKPEDEAALIACEDWDVADPDDDGVNHAKVN